MSILVYTETHNGKYRKNAYEVVSFAKAIAEKEGKTVVAIGCNASNPEELFAYGAQKVINLSQKSTCPKALGKELAKHSEGCDTLIASHSAEGSSVAPFWALAVDAALITNVISLPEDGKIKRNAFSGKGIMTASTSKDKVLYTLSVNAFGLHPNEVAGEVQNMDWQPQNESVTVTQTEESSGKLDLKEAEIVVSAGRGLKGPDNWEMIEKLADTLGAATACSKPVSDLGWRPHSEHVGQTGKAISPNLYIAIGISGAIQHLAGVNSSKTIVVINTDPEAPFFKSADYGIVGDAFEVVPKLISALEAHKN